MNLANTDDQATLPNESFAQAFHFPADASASNIIPTPEGSPEVKKLSYHEPGKPRCLCVHRCKLPEHKHALDAPSIQAQNDKNNSIK